MVADKVRYTALITFVLALLIVKWKLRPYFQAHYRTHYLFNEMRTQKLDLLGWMLYAGRSN